MRDVIPPQIEINQRQLECVKCGAQTAAVCSCGMSYRQATVRAQEYAEANPRASVREIKEAAGVGHGTAQEAKARVRDRTPDTVVGRDGKEYAATKPPIPTTPITQEHKIVTKLANELVDAGYKVLSGRFSDQATLARLKAVRDDLRSHVNQPVEWF
jgi:hypothetical protein